MKTTLNGQRFNLSRSWRGAFTRWKWGTEFRHMTQFGQRQYNIDSINDSVHITDVLRWRIYVAPEHAAWLSWESTTNLNNNTWNALNYQIKARYKWTDGFDDSEGIEALQELMNYFQYLRNEVQNLALAIITDTINLSRNTRKVLKYGLQWVDVISEIKDIYTWLKGAGSGTDCFLQDVDNFARNVFVVTLTTRGTGRNACFEGSWASERNNSGRRYRECECRATLSRCQLKRCLKYYENASLHHNQPDAESVKTDLNAPRLTRVTLHLYARNGGSGVCKILSQQRCAREIKCFHEAEEGGMYWYTTKFLIISLLYKF